MIGTKYSACIQLEIINFHYDGELRNRVFQHQRVFKLPFFIGNGEFAENFVGEIALAIIQTGGYV